ncbi:MAG: hypothetical protein GX339_09490 [Tissierellia bacterium]|nr:hypothetical protein [Tissierellia bacterium]
MRNCIKEFKINLKVNKEVLYKNLHIYEGSNIYYTFEELYDELKVLVSTMEVKAAYIITASFPLEIGEEVEKYVVCFLSTHCNLPKKLMDEGEYLKGYLLNEMIIHGIFNISDEMDNQIRQEVNQCGYKLSKRYAAGDGIDLKNQGKFLEELKKYISTDAIVNEQNVMEPAHSLLYIYTVKKGVNEEINPCLNCKNRNCPYKKVD